MLSLLEEKQRSTVYSGKAGEQRSEMTKKIYLLLLIELDVLKALKGILFFGKCLSEKDP